MRELTIRELDMELAEQLPARELMSVPVSVTKIISSVNGNGNGNGNGNTTGTGIISVANGDLDGDLDGNSLIINTVVNVTV